MEVPIPAIDAAARAQAEADRGDREEAMHDYFEAIKFAPWWPDAYFDLAVAMRANNWNAKSTVPVMRTYLELAPQGAHAGRANELIAEWQLHPYPRIHKVIPD